MKKEDWNKVENALDGPYGQVVLMVDGFRVTFRKCLIAKNRLGIITYVNGELKGTWFSDAGKESQERKYLRPYSVYAWKATARVQLKKLGKKYCKRMDIDPDEKRHGVRSDWSTAQQIRRYYQKTFKDIELVEVL